MTTKTNIKKKFPAELSEEEATAQVKNTSTGHRSTGLVLVTLDWDSLHILFKASRGGASEFYLWNPLIFLHSRWSFATQNFENAIGRDFQIANALHDKMKNEGVLLTPSIFMAQKTPLQLPCGCPTVTVRTLWVHLVKVFWTQVGFPITFSKIFTCEL